MDDDMIVGIDVAEPDKILLMKKEDIDKVEAELKVQLEGMDDAQAMNALLGLTAHTVYGKMGTSQTIKSDSSTTYQPGPLSNKAWTSTKPPTIDYNKWKLWIDGRQTDFPEADKVPKPEFDVEQLMNMAQLSQTPSLQRAVDELATVIKRLAEKYHLGPIASLALVKMVEVNVFQALVGAINEQHGGKDVKDD